MLPEYYMLYNTYVKHEPLTLKEKHKLKVFMVNTWIIMEHGESFTTRNFVVYTVHPIYSG